jgi:hypothetical protein
VFASLGFLELKSSPAIAAHRRLSNFPHGNSGAGGRLSDHERAPIGGGQTEMIIDVILE